MARIKYGPCNRCGKKDGREITKEQAQRLDICTINFEDEFLCFECYEKIANPNKQTVEQMAAQFPIDDSVKETVREYNKMRRSSMHYAAAERRKRFYGK